MFTKDNRTEIFLSQMGVDFVYTNKVNFRDLRPGWEVTNLARPISIREDAVLEYATLMESGSPAPAPMLHKSDSWRDVLDGVQRLAAAKIVGYSTFSAYDVTCDSEDLLAAIRVLANSRLQGRPEPPDWTKRRAVEVLVIQRGLTVSEVARMGGWAVADVERLKTVLEWGFKLRCIGGPQLPDNVITTISKHTSLDELDRVGKPIAELCNILKAAKFTNAESEPFIEQFFSPIHKASRSHEIYAERLEELRADPEVQVRCSGRRMKPQGDDAVLRRTLRSAETIAARIADHGESLAYADEFFRLLNCIERHLRSVAKHPKPRTARVPADLWSSDDTNA